MNCQGISGLIYAFELIAFARDGLYDDEDQGNKSPCEILKDFLLSKITYAMFIVPRIPYDTGIALRFVDFHELHYDCPLFEWCPDV